MKKVKSFDCIKMKRAIQAKRAKEYAGMSDAEIEQHIWRTLATSDHPVAAWRRRVTAYRKQTDQA